MSVVVFDIESVLDPTLHYEPPTDKQDHLAPPIFWQVVCIGYCQLDEARCAKRIGALVGVEEPRLIGGFTSKLAASTKLVGFNSRKFDMPVLVARSIVHGLSLAWWYQTRGARYRFSTEAHEDLLDELSDYGATRGTGGLDVWARACGFPGKVGATGDDIAGWYAAGQHDLIAVYCLCDVVQTAGLALRSWLVRGECDREEYVTAARSLLAIVETDERVRPLAGKVDIERFLLGEPRLAREESAA